MRPMAVVLVGIVSAIPVLRVQGQTVRIMGTVKDADGTPLTARIVVTVDGRKVKDITSNKESGEYNVEVIAQQAKMIILCTAIVDPDAVHYETNPLKKEPPFKDYDFTFHRVTTEASYWRNVTKNVDREVTTVRGSGFGEHANREWNSIKMSRLPPDSKAAAARQFKTMAWSKGITDATFSDYVVVDDKTLELAMHGDQKALASLPASVKNDVTQVKPMAESECADAKGSWQPNTGQIPGNGVVTQVSVAFPSGTSSVLGGFARTLRQGIDTDYVAACLVNPAQPPTTGNSAQRRCDYPANDMSVEQCSAAGSSLVCWYVNSKGANTKTVQVFGCFK